MCDPVTAGALAATGAGTGVAVSAIQAEQQRRANKKAQRTAEEQLRDTVVRNERAVEDARVAASEELLKTRREEQKFRGAATVAAADAGIKGLSVGAMLREIGFKSGERETSILRNLEVAQDSGRLANRTAFSDTQQYLNNLLDPPPLWLIILAGSAGAAAQGGSAAAGAAAGSTPTAPGGVTTPPPPPTSTSPAGPQVPRVQPRGNVVYGRYGAT